MSSPEASIPQNPPVTDPSVLGGNVIPSSTDEVYRQKLEFLEGVIQAQTTVKVDAKCAVLVRSFGGYPDVERHDVWEAVKAQEAVHASREVSGILTDEAANVSKPEEEKDIFDKILTTVTLDWNGTADPSRVRSGPDVTDMSVGGELEALVDSDEIHSPAVLAKATKTIRLLVANGRYKLHRWGNGNQLATALDLMETYAKRVPEFSLAAAGFGEADASLTMSLAALQVDQKSKPNYQFAKPERGYLLSQTNENLRRLARATAHDFIRRQPFDLPPQVSSYEQPPAK